MNRPGDEQFPNLALV